MLPYLPPLLLLLLFCFYANGEHTNRVQYESAPTSFAVDYDNDRFTLDGKPFRYISGSIHYFRIHPQMWRDRLKRVRALGFNAIQYYVPWNFHEFEEGHYEWSGMRNFTEFSKIAAELGMYTLLRVGPYVCGEWENGGIPWWLLNKGDMKMRSSDPRWLSEVDKWFSVLLPMVGPLLRENGGPVLMVQIENEYGSYDACDKNYTIWLRDLTRKHLGNNVVLYTTDGGSDGYLKCGAIPGVLPTVDFGPMSEQKINESFAAQRKYLPKGPLVNSEFYPGWLVLWGQKDQSVPTGEEIVEAAKVMYRMGANINFYMIHGGTNFGFWNGAEINAPCITSYDYSAPISEAGDVTRNYRLIRDWIKTIDDWPNKPQIVPYPNRKSSYGKIRVKHVESLSEIAFGKTCVVEKNPISFEQLEHPLGYVMYYTKLGRCGTNLTIPLLKDFGFVYLDQVYQGTFVNRFNNITIRSLTIKNCKIGENLYIMVENQGRQTYETINDHKGILSDVLLDGSPLYNWTHCKVELPLIEQRIRKLSRKLKTPKVAGDHGIYMGEMSVNVVSDTFIDTTGWGKGVVLVNGVNLGRYWATQGPQMTLYVPAQFLHRGPNSVLIIELEGANHDCHDGFCSMESIDHPIFNFTSTENRVPTERLYRRKPQIEL